MIINLTGVLDDGTVQTSGAPFLPYEQDQRIPAGEDVTFNLKVVTGSGAAANITNFPILLSVRKNPTDASALISLLFTITNGAGGLASVTVPASSTFALAPGRFYFDVWATDTANPPNRSQIVPLSNWQSLQAVGQPSQAALSVTPSSIVAYGLPAPDGVTGHVLGQTAPNVLGWIAGGAGYATIDANGVAQTQRQTLNFAPRLSAVDNPGATRTDVDLAASGVTAGTYSSVTVDQYGRVTAGTNPGYLTQAYQTVQQAASSLTQRSTLNFTARFAAVDNSGSARTDVDLAASGVTAGSYTWGDGGAGVSGGITVDTFGRVTSVTSGAPKLQNIYNNGGAGPQTIVVDSSRVAVRIADAATPIGATLFDVTNNAGTVEYFRVNSSGIAVTGPLAIGTAQTVYASWENTTASTSGVPSQFSPLLQWKATVWNATSSASNVQAMAVGLRPVSGAVPYNEWVLWNSNNGAALAELFKVSPTVILHQTNGVNFGDSTHQIGNLYLGNNGGSGGMGAIYFDGGTTEYITGQSNSSGLQLGGGGHSGTIGIGPFGMTINPPFNGAAGNGALTVNRVDNGLISGGAIIAVQDNNSSSVGALAIALNSGAAHVFCYGEYLVASGSITAGEVVVWSGSNKVSAAAATNNLSTIAGVATMTVTDGASLFVARKGRCLTLADAGIAAGQLVGSSGAVAGNCQSGTTPGAGAILGRACEATGGTTAGKVIVDLTLG